MSVEEQEQKLKEMQAEIDKLNDRHKNDQEYIRKRDEDVGSLRQEMKDLQEKISQNKSGDGEGNSPAGKKNDEPEPTLEELQDSMTEAQQKAAEDIWQSLSEDKRKQYFNDEDAMREFYSTVKTVEEAVPETPWRKREPKQKRKVTNIREEILAAVNKANEGTKTPSEPGKSFASDASGMKGTNKNIARGAGVLQAISMDRG